MKKRSQVSNDARFVGQARRHAMLLAANHGLEYPELVEIVRRIDEHHDRLLQLEEFEKRSAFMHGKPKK